MNNIGKSVKGKKAPPPLPMYQPVVLKHVPTMVRRRYDHFDVHNLDSNHDHHVQDDGLLDASDEDELEEDLGPGEISSEHGLPESEDTDLQGSGPSSEVDCGVSVECQHSGEGNSADDRDNDRGAYDETASNGTIQPTDLETEHSSSEENEYAVVNQACIVDSNLEEEDRDKTLTEFTNEQDLQAEYSSSEENGSEVNRALIMGSNLEEEDRDKKLTEFIEEQDHHLENNEDDVPEVVNCAPIIDPNLDEDETEDKRLAEFVNEQGLKMVGFHVGDSISEENGDEDPNTPTYPSVKDKAYSIGKNGKGKRVPLPLPMYQPVVLKHVPTMVRRRYDHFDVDKLDSNHDHIQDDGLLDANDEDELEEDMGPGKTISEHGLPESEETDLQDSRSSSEMECGVSVECQHSGDANSADDRDNDIGAYDETISNGTIQPTDSQTEYSSSEENGSEVVNRASIVDSNLGEEAQDKMPTEFIDELGECKGEDNGSGDVETASHCSLKDEALDYVDGNSVNEQDGHFENNEDHVPEVVNCAPIIDLNLAENGTHDKRLAELVNEQGVQCFNVGDSIIEEVGDEDANTPTYPSVKDETFDMTEGNSVNERVSADASVNSEAEEPGRGSSHDILVTIPQVDTEDFSTADLIRDRSLNLKDLEREGDGTNDINECTDDKDADVNTELPSDAHQSLNNEGFNPEAFRKTVKEDGYELCCPVCKHSITNTLIYHRRGNSQHDRTTCFTGLLALFCCLRD